MTEQNQLNDNKKESEICPADIKIHCHVSLNRAFQRRMTGIQGLVILFSTSIQHRWLYIYIYPESIYVTSWNP